MMRILTFFVLSLCGVATFVSAQDETKKEPLTRDVVAELVSAGVDEPLQAKVDLGKLPAGGQLVLDLLLKNSSDQDIRFSGVSKKCSCSQFKPEKKLIPALGATKARLTLRIPGRNKTASASNTVSLVYEEKIVANIELEFQLQGLLAFKELMDKVVFDSNESSKLVRIPFLATPPIQVDKVQARLSDNLAGVRTEIEPTADGGLLKLNIPADVLVDGDLRGEIYLGHPDLLDADCLWLLVKDARQSEISPQTILFHRSESGLVAKVIVRTAKVTSGPVSNTVASESPQIACTFAEMPLEIKSKKLGLGVYQVQCTADAKLAAKISDSNAETNSSKNVLHWKISNGKATSNLTTPFVVEVE